jgi:hypothetical protein
MKKRSIASKCILFVDDEINILESLKLVPISQADL